jgi:hypothetical protein
MIVVTLMATNKTSYKTQKYRKNTLHWLVKKCRSLFYSGYVLALLNPNVATKLPHHPPVLRRRD